MALQADITISIGKYACNIALQPDSTQEKYLITLEQKETYTNLKLLYYAEFVLIWDESVQQLISPKHKMTPPDPYYWVEIKQLVSGHIMANR